MSDEKIISGGNFLARGFSPEEVFTPEDLCPEQKMYAKTARDFMDREVIPASGRIEEKDYACLKALMKKAGELGLLMSDVPEEHGGLGLDKASTAVIAENLTGQGSFATTWGAHTGIGTLPLVYFASDGIKDKYLPALAEGKLIAAYCLTESSAGSDALSLRTKAVLSDDETHYTLNGTKQFITNGAIADTFVVFAKIDGRSLTGFLLSRDMEGLKIGPEEHKLGIRGSSTTTVILEDVKVPVENLLGEIGKGHKIAFNVLNVGRYKLGVTAIGAAKRAFAEGLAYALERKQFGVKIADFGMIREKIANIYIRTWAAEAAAYRTVGLIDKMIAGGGHSPGHTIRSIEEYSLECAMIKILGTECLDYVVDENLQIHGGYGFSSEYPAELHYRDSRINRIFEGTNEINRLLVSTTLLRKAASVPESPPAPKAGGLQLAGEAALVANLKKLALMALGAARERYGAEIADKQMLLSRCADLVISAFVAESALLRAEKIIAGKGREKAALEIAAARITCEEKTAFAETIALEAISAIAKDGELKGMVSGIRELTLRMPADILGMKEFIAERIISGARSPFA